jgi:hypothetical protein
MKSDCSVTWQKKLTLVKKMDQWISGLSKTPIFEKKKKLNKSQNALCLALRQKTTFFFLDQIKNIFFASQKKSTNIHPNKQWFLFSRNQQKKLVIYSELYAAGNRKCEK